ncbi:DUF4369 domain-containing protein [Galbibacter sp. EGI 63066]|uniref:DUF4369 domain-containing protein n=1 Tax=Galbibacter sp. EGI 63066 TaxID=2993559 RepID=UPI002248E183|nr:DUF4369 domain-containing protein [Galbibacter sp. EGI 63066]MCX2679650.1 DUF4369 domain-containing protein [Galbibacter sp. EGI 63066]
MYRILITGLLALFLFSCGKEKANMIVKGNVEGLKKGTLYFQKNGDSSIVSIDSLTIDGNADFTFSTNVENPEIFYLYLDKNDGNPLNDRFEFFGEEGTITINTTRDYFAPEAQVEGSKSHEKLAEYKKMISKFSNKNLDLIKETLDATKSGDTILADSLQKVSDNNMRRSYLYTLNFAINNKESYAAPYIILSNADNINVKFLDSINKTLSSEISNSKYGKMLAEYIDKRKELQEAVKDSIQ